MKNQPFGMVYSGIMIETYDGVIGFSYPAFSQTDNKTFLDRLVEQGQIKSRRACVKLREKKTAESEFILGGCDVETKNYAPVMKKSGKYTGWRLNMTKVVLRSPDDQSEVLSLEPYHETVLDTGAGNNLGNEQ